MNRSTLLSLSFTLSLIFISHGGRLPMPVATSTKLYQTVCKDVGKDANRCLKLLEAYPEITSAKTNLTLCRHVLEMAIERSTEARNYFIKTMNKNPSSAAIKKCATDFYYVTVKSFKDALSELVSAPDAANYEAKIAGDGPVNCNSALGNEKIVNPSFSKLNNDIDFISFVAFLATNHLPKAKIGN
ncbi:hypothetical protein VNO77_42094 [Canavalia gladiata]|uniref:Pectinesterase inhibitor domain-containing protein n=1 Tax=Canavalia gladiata TaxID=3824 RepID=A0AAN9K0F0_CANGL